MSDQELAVDHTQYVQDGLAFYRAAAEEGNGHTMEPWQLEDSTMGHRISSRCSRCGWTLKIVIGHTYDLMKFPASAQAAASTAVAAKCLSSVTALTKDNKAS